MDQKPRKTRKHLYLPGLLKRTKCNFDKIKDPISPKTSLSLSDCLMSGLAVFSLKYPSLLQFEKSIHSEKIIRHNLQSLYGIKQAPCDTYLRERLDEVEPKQLQKNINRIIAQLQRGKVLEQFRYYNDYCLVSIDGTGYFNSEEIHCESCCEKHHRDGRVTYYHQILGAVMMHPQYSTVFPLAIEPVRKQNGMSKNDCEYNAAKRLLVNLRTSHPHLKMIIVLDGLYADAPMIKLLKELKFHSIITAKQNDLKYLFEFYKASKKGEVKTSDENKETGLFYTNKLPLNDKNSDVEVNVLECFEKTKKGNKHFCWITDLELSDKNVEIIAKGGRARWRIENETFNTLKNQGYQFEHNFGHGEKHLSTIFAYLMFTAFLIDQIQQYACKYFKAALAWRGSRTALWEKIRGVFFHYYVEVWEHLYTSISQSFNGARLEDMLDTS